MHKQNAYKYWMRIVAYSYVPKNLHVACIFHKKKRVKK